MTTEQTESRLCSIESRLSKIEAALYETKGHATPPSACVPDVKKPLPTNAAKQEIAEPQSGNWLGLIAVICFVLAAGFIIKLSIDSGWLTPTRQICIASLFGFGLIGAGFRLLDTDKSYASFLPAAGTIILYASTFAAYDLYGLITNQMAVGITAVVSGLCLWLFHKIQHDIYALIASVGAYLSPAVLGFHASTHFAVFYYLICSVSFAVVSVWVNSRLLTIVSSYLALIMTFWAGLTLHQELLLASILAGHFIVFSVGSFFYSYVKNKPLTSDESWALLPVLLLFYACEYYTIARIHPELAPWFSLGFASFLLVLYAGAKTLFANRIHSHTSIMLFVSVAFFHSIYLELLPEPFKPWLVVIILGTACVLPAQTAQQHKVSTSPFFFPVLAALAVLCVEYLSILFHLFSDNDWTMLPAGTLTILCLWVLVSKTDPMDKSKNHQGHILLSAAHAMSIVALYRLTADVGSLAVSASWLLYAVGVIAFSFKRKDMIMANSALLVLGFAAAKALLYDAASAPTLIRILCLVMTGVVLYGCGLLMRKAARWQS